MAQPSLKPSGMFKAVTSDTDGPQKKRETKKYGPYGSKLPTTSFLSINVKEEFEEVRVGHGTDVIESIGFVVKNTSNGVKTTVEFNESKGTIAKIRLGRGEKIEKISGTYGNYDKHPTKGIVIATLKIHTNTKPEGYGPYGSGNGVTSTQTFDSSLDTKSPIVGFFGRHDDYMESLGVEVEE